MDKALKVMSGPKNVAADDVIAPVTRDHRDTVGLSCVACDKTVWITARVRHRAEGTRSRAEPRCWALRLLRTRVQTVTANHEGLVGGSLASSKRVTKIVFVAMIFFNRFSPSGYRGSNYNNVDSTSVSSNTREWIK